MIRPFTKSVLLALILILIPHGVLAARVPLDCYSTKWPHEMSELKPDPAIHYGRLDNGLRYILRKNEEPRDRVGLYLNVEAGSLYEADSERGYAHFLEHMLFNGTVHFPPGTLIDYFQSIGMGFGADVNGYTTYTDTVYKLILPQGNYDSLDQGLTVMRDYADGALLLDSEIDKERGVILAEKTARDSANYRGRLARNAFIFSNTTIPERQPIGTEEAVAAAGRKDLQQFYQRWYRPDNLILIMVGDFDLEEARKLIVTHFGSMRAQETGSCPEYGSVEHSGIATFYHYEPELGKTDVSIEVVRNKVPENDSLELQKENILRYMVSKIINYRLSRLQEAVDTPFISAGYYDTVMLDRFSMAGIRATAKKENWRASLAQIDEVLRQALRYGLFKNELERVKKDLQADLERRVKTADTRSTMSHIGRIKAHLNGNRVLQSPSQELETFGPFLDKISVGDLNRVLNQNWAGDQRLVLVIGDGELPGKSAEDQLLTYYQELGDRKIRKPEQPDAVSFPYLAVDRPPAPPVSAESYQDIEVQRSNFEHGLILNMKVTDFKKDQVRVALHFGDGRKSLPREGLDLLASSVVNGSGTAKLTKTQLQEALTGSSVKYGFRVADESFVLEGRAITAELELLFQVISTLLEDPGFRSSVYQISMKNFDSMYHRLTQSIEGSARLHLQRFFSGNARGTGLPAREQFLSLQLDEVVSWLKPYFDNAPLELSVVGDFDPTLVEQLASKYFDRSEARPLVEYFSPQAQFPVEQSLEVSVDSAIDKALIRYGWLTTDAKNISRKRRLHVLAAVLEERLRNRLREELGTTYSPSVYSVNSQIYPGYGVIYADVIVDVNSVKTAVQTLDEIEASLVQKPVAEDELQRALAPILTSVKDAYRTNGYWLQSVLSLSSREEAQLQWPLTLITDFNSITHIELHQLAREYIRKERRAVGIVKSGESAVGRSIDQRADGYGILSDNNS